MTIALFGKDRQRPLELTVWHAKEIDLVEVIWLGAIKVVKAEKAR